MGVLSRFNQSLERFEIFNDKGRYPTVRATLYFLLIPLMIISLMESFYDVMYLTLLCILIGYKDIRGYVVLKQFKFIQLLRISVILYFVSAFFSLVVVKIMSYFGIDDPQGIRDSVLSNEEYYRALLKLPFIAIGEEFLKFLIFISFFILLSQFSKYTKLIIAVILASFVFGHLHIIGYELTAGLPLMIGAIPGFIFMIYYRSLLPLIIEHFIFDFLSFTIHSQYVLVTYLVFIALVIFLFTSKPKEKVKYVSN